MPFSCIGLDLCSVQTHNCNLLYFKYVDYVNGGEDVNGHGSHVAGTIAGRKSSDGITNEDGFVE